MIFKLLISIRFLKLFRNCIDHLIMQLSNHLIFDDLLKLAVCVLHPKKNSLKGTTTGSNITLPNPLSLSQLIITFILFILIVLQINRLVQLLLESELNLDKRYQMFRDENDKTR